MTPFLRTYANRGVIIASSVLYDLRAGDFEGLSCLADIPHVVVAISDFRTLWLRLAVGGLADSSEVEWMAMPSPSGKRYFGFLLLKPAGSSFPVVLNPSPVSYRYRIVSVADAVPSPHGVLLREAVLPPLDWLGAMEHAVKTAAAVFEVGSRSDAVMMAALAWDGASANSERSARAQPRVFR